MTDTAMNQTVSPRLMARAGAIAMGVVVLSWLHACEKHSEGDGHNHGTAAAPVAAGDAHAHEAQAAHLDEITLTPEAIERYGVKVTQAQMWILKPTFIAPARVAFNSEAMAHVGSLVRGRAVEINVRLGDHVTRGDTLVVVESPELGQAQADLLLKRTAAETSRPQVDLAKAAWDRAKGLLEQSQGISITEVQRREAEYKAAIAGVKAAEAAAVASENTLHLLGMDQRAVEQLIASTEIVPRYAVRASIDGQVVQREITLGELVSPDRESLMVLADTTTLWVLADVPESRLSSVAVGARAWVAVGFIAGGGSAGQKFEGQVAFISPFVDPTTRTAQVRVEIPRGALGNGAMRPGMFAQVEIVAAAPDGTDPSPLVAVPQDAIQTVEGGPAVFVPVAGEPGTFQKRALTIGATVGGLVPVFAGLVEGERFVESGSFILKAELGKGSAAHDH